MIGVPRSTCISMHAMLSWPSDVYWLLPSLIGRCQTQGWTGKCYLLWCMINIFQTNAWCFSVAFWCFARALFGRSRWYFLTDKLPLSVEVYNITAFTWICNFHLWCPCCFVSQDKISTLLSILSKLHQNGGVFITVLINQKGPFIIAKLCLYL